MLETISPDYNNPSAVVNDLASSLENGESCNIKGRIRLERVMIQLVLHKIYYRLLDKLSWISRIS